MNNIQKWHQLLSSGNTKDLKKLLSKDCVFYSPIVFKPQKGRKLAQLYLTAAFKVLIPGDFKYVKEANSESHSMLEFQCEIDGVKVEGIDIITWNDAGEIIEFKVMIRPFRAIEKVGEKMKKELESMSILDKALLAIKS